MNRTQAQTRLPDELGLLAGGGRYPLLLAAEAKRAGVRRLVALAVIDEADGDLEQFADETVWIHAGELDRAITAMHDAGVRHMIFSGQITPERLFKGLDPDDRTKRLLASLDERNAETIFGAIAAEFVGEGIAVLPATAALDDHLADDGAMGRVQPDNETAADIDFGVSICREIGRLDIGQTVVVKQGTVLAVEGFEGTDQAILRGGELGHGGVTVVKLPKRGQDPRFDIPCVGLQTVKSLVAAGARALAVQAGGTLLIDKPELVAAFDREGIALFGVRPAGDRRTGGATG
jgi:hypothetical protein